MRNFAVLFIGLMTIICSQAWAQGTPVDAEMDIRAREIGRSLRCVVCQNQSIEDSDAVLAEDMRTLVRRRLQEGDSNEQVIAFMHERYGDFVLLKPPVQSNTYLLWFTPFALLGGFLIWYLVRVRRTSSAAVVEHTPLNADEKETLAKLLETDE